VNDKVPQAEQVLTDLFPNYKRTLFQFMAYDAETVFPDETFDLVVAASVIQWFTNPDKFFESVSNILNPQGLFVFNTFGALNLKECRTLTGKGLKSYGIEETKQMLSKDFHILVSFEEEIILNFPNPRHVLRHLQKTGVNGLKPEKWTKNHLKNFETLYSEKFSNSKEVQLTYHPQYFAAVKK
jgi:ubiquinone/menaquinone biosynthesis C-methylase UbiE